MLGVEMGFTVFLRASEWQLYGTDCNVILVSNG
jgi:hypothetical protein